MALVPAHKILNHARMRRYGIPCLLAGNLEMLIGQVRAAEKAQAPLILAFNVAVTPQVPMDLVMPAMVSAAKQAAVPIATILDHGSSLEQAILAIELGSSSVMYDGSSLPFEENVRSTKEVVRAAHTAGVSVEGELGAVGGSSVELASGGIHTSSFTDPDLATEFVDRTGIDVLAVSFGNAHGIYRGAPELDLSLVREIAGLVEVPLAMHGASGLAFERYAAVIDSGISKINYYTAMARAVAHRLRDRLTDAPEDQLVYHRVISASIEEFEADTLRLLDALRCAGRCGEI